MAQGVFSCRRFMSATSPGAAPLSARAPPEPPPSPIVAAAAPSSPVNTLEELLRGEQNLLTPFPFPCAQQQLRRLAGEADPLPSRAGRSGCSGFLPDPLGMRRLPRYALHLAALEVMAERRFPRLGRRSTAARRHAAPASGVSIAAPRTHKSWAAGSCTGGPDLKGAYPLALVHRGLVGCDHDFLSRWIKDPWLSRAAFF
jgi:hypothetical protein